MSSFYADVIVHDHRFNTLDRVADPLLLEPVTRAAVQAIMADAEAESLPLMLFETYRSQQRQETLFLQHRTQLRIVGCHHTGTAADLVRLVDGQPNWAVDYGFLGKLARRHNLVWGGDWAGFRDMDHVQRVRVTDQPRLFAGTFYPDANYSPYAAEQPKTRVA